MRLAFCCLLLLASALAQPLRIHYGLDLTRNSDHRFGVTMDIAGALGDHLDVQMPSWYPGRYSIYNFAANVSDFVATCGSSSLPVTRVDPSTWRLETHSCLNQNAAEVRYSVYGNDLSGSFAQLDSTHANVNGGPVLMYVVDHKPDPVSLTVKAPAGWKVLSALGELNQTEIAAPDYDILIDAPIEAGPDFTLDTFQQDGRTYRVMMHSYGAEGNNHPRLVQSLERLVATENRVFGPPPDLKTYTFFMHFDPAAREGDGMEHLFGTQIILPMKLSDDGALRTAEGVAAHEFFHQWNVKRLRPKELGPWDYTRPNPTRCLWIAEGVTEYYGEIFPTRAGLASSESYLSGLAKTISHFQQAPGHREMSAEISSLTAWFHDATPLRQETNHTETIISYYIKGDLVGLLLDLDLRRRTNGSKSLDDVMRSMWKQFYLGESNSYYLPGHGYSQEDFQHATEAVAGTSYAAFFRDYVSGTVELPYNDYFSAVGLRLDCSPAAHPYFGLGLQGNRITMVDPQGPAAAAGLGIDDVIESINGRTVDSDKVLDTLRSTTAGHPTSLRITRHEHTLDITLTPAPAANSECKLNELPNATAQQKAIRQAWLTQP